MIMGKISVDFDNTLSQQEVQDFVKNLIENGFVVYIITSRVDNKFAKERNWWWVEKQNRELFDVADSLGIDKDNIIFTQYIDKVEFIEDKDFILHLDDDMDEIDLINKSSDPCVSIFKDPHGKWIEKCEKLC